MKGRGMTTFEERGKGFEEKYKHDKELEFKVNARRNRLLGLWVAKELGIPAAEAEAYAKSVVEADFERLGQNETAYLAVLYNLHLQPHRDLRLIARLSYPALRPVELRGVAFSDRNGTVRPAGRSTNRCPSRAQLRLFAIAASW